MRHCTTHRFLYTIYSTYLTLSILYRIWIQQNISFIALLFTSKIDPYNITYKIFCYFFYFFFFHLKRGAQQHVILFKWIVVIKFSISIWNLLYTYDTKIIQKNHMPSDHHHIYPFYKTTAFEYIFYVCRYVSFKMCNKIL